jgi:hypothetical protein
MTPQSGRNGGVNQSGIPIDIIVRETEGSHNWYPLCSVHHLGVLKTRSRARVGTQKRRDLVSRNSEEMRRVLRGEHSRCWPFVSGKSDICIGQTVLKMESRFWEISERILSRAGFLNRIPIRCERIVSLYGLCRFLRRLFRELLTNAPRIAHKCPSNLRPRKPSILPSRRRMASKSWYGECSL